MGSSTHALTRILSQALRFLGAAVSVSVLGGCVCLCVWVRVFVCGWVGGWARGAGRAVPGCLGGWQAGWLGVWWLGSVCLCPIELLALVRVF